MGLIQWCAWHNAYYHSAYKNIFLFCRTFHIMLNKTFEHLVYVTFISTSLVNSIIVAKPTPAILQDYTTRYFEVSLAIDTKSMPLLN